MKLNEIHPDFLNRPMNRRLYFNSIWTFYQLYWRDKKTLITKGRYKIDIELFQPYEQ